MIHFFWNQTYAAVRWTAPAHPGSGGGKLCANSEIAWHMAEGIKARFGAAAVKLHSMGTAEVGATEDDVLVGHIGPWANIALERQWRRIVPIIGWPSELKHPYDRFSLHEAHLSVLRRAPSFVALCGAWVWEHSAQDPVLARFRKKAVQAPLGFSRDLFPQVKRSFNPPGQRGFLYVGQVSEQKGVGYVDGILAELGYRYLIGNGEWATGKRSAHCEVTGWLDNADAPTWVRLAEQADFFVCATQWDCQPVAPLENISRGFVPMLTPANCFETSIPLTGQHAEDRETFERWQNAPEAELVEMQAKAMDGLAELKWETTLDVIAKEIEERMSGEALRT